jgi:hypothetical protein
MRLGRIISNVALATVNVARMQQGATHGANCSRYWGNGKVRLIVPPKVPQQNGGSTCCVCCSASIVTDDGDQRGRTIPCRCIGATPAGHRDNTHATVTESG